MPIVINTNLQSLNAQRHLGKTQTDLSRTMSKLSSGLRINSAADDAAGLALSEVLKNRVRGLQQAGRNANDGISYAQTADGGLEEVNAMLIRMKELATQSSSGTYTSAQRANADTEYQQLLLEIDRVANTTEFNGLFGLNGSSGTVTMQVGDVNNTNNQIGIAQQDTRIAALGVSGGSVTTVANANTAMTAIDTAVNTVAGVRATFGAAQNRLQVAYNNVASMGENLSAANSRVRDADLAFETANLTKQSILMQAGVSVLAQANQFPSVALSLLQ